MMHNRDELTLLRKPDSILISMWSKGRCGIWEQEGMIIIIPKIKCDVRSEGQCLCCPDWLLSYLAIPSLFTVDGYCVGVSFIASSQTLRPELGPTVHSPTSSILQIYQGNLSHLSRAVMGTGGDPTFLPDLCRHIADVQIFDVQLPEVSQLAQLRRELSEARIAVADKSA